MSDGGLVEFIESLLHTQEMKLRRLWWLFFSLPAPDLPNGAPVQRHVWPPFLGLRVEIGGDRHV